MLAPTSGTAGKPPTHSGVHPKTTVTSSDALKLPVTREMLITAQKADPSLAKCFSSLETEQMRELHSYFVDEGVLMRTWRSHATRQAEHEQSEIGLPDQKPDWSTVYQLVVPAVYP